MSTKIKKSAKRCSEASFTLLETVIALAIVSFLIVEVAAVQGNAIIFSDYGRNVTEATWLARRVLSQVEYNWRTKPVFKELITNVTEQKFEDSEEYLYSLEIKEWKFPLTKLLEMVMGGDRKKKDDSGNDKDARSKTVDNSNDGMIEQVVKQVFGDEPVFLTARVEVTWAEGAQRNGTSMTYLMTNQNKLSEAIVQLKDTYTKLTKPPAAKGPGKPGGNPGPGGNSPPPVIPLNPNDPNNPNNPGGAGNPGNTPLSDPQGTNGQ